MAFNDDLPTYEQTIAVPPEIRPLNLSRNLSRELMKTELITPDECIAHLKLLASIADLRNEISTTDFLFGLEDRLIDNFAPEKIKYQAGARVREKRWAAYVTRAVDRFEAWYNFCIPTTAAKVASPIEMLTIDDIEAQNLSFSKAPETTERIEFTVDNLPPLDVIMVWHAYMLNPRILLDDCLRRKKMNFWVTGMPWEAVNKVLDNRTFKFKPTAAMIKNFEQLTGHPWDNLHEPPAKALKCPRCFGISLAEWVSETPADIDTLSQFEEGVGYADRDFKMSCPVCGFNISHDTLRVAKFRQDIHGLLQNKVPMPGTLLSKDGVPESLQADKNNNVLLPNKIMMLPKIRDEILRIIDPSINPSASVVDIRNFFTTEFETTFNIIHRSGLHSPRLPEEKLSFRRMMARYWTNSSPFGLDLVGAVIRQGTFITKITSINWIRSPGLDLTIHNLINKYSIFMRIIELNATLTAVPTIDVDLAWHTHQLSPKHYFHYTTTRTGRFINHDDKISEGALSTAFEKTSREYQILTNGKPYSECVCWYCESIREANNTHTLFFSRWSPANSRENADILREDPKISHDPASCAHISAHNAIPPFDEESKWDAEAVVRRLKWKYASAFCRIDKKRISKQGGPKYGVTSRMNQSFSYSPVIWGYPIYTPFYMPYGADQSITRGLYATSPACLSTEQEVTGGICIAGACGTGLSETLGGCAGNGGGGDGGGCGGGGD